MAIKKSIKFSDKHKTLVKFYDKNFDEDEFNNFIIQLLISYRDMKKQKIDLLLLSQLLKERPSNLDTIGIISLIQNININTTEDNVNNNIKKEVNNKNVIKEINSNKNDTKENIKIEKQEKNIETNDATDDYNPILLMGNLADE